MTRTRNVAMAALAAMALASAGLAACGSGSGDPRTTIASTGPQVSSSGRTPQPAAAHITVPTATPTAQEIGLEPQVGPLFKTGDSHPHACTASVIHSPGHDLLLTAAHCVTGPGIGELFAPDYRNGAEPFGIWRVVRVWASPAWIASTDPDVDVAVLQVAPRTVAGQVDQVEDLVGAETLGSTPAAGTSVEVVGYTQGINDRQITCNNVLVQVDGVPAFSCHGYVGGTSGSPFLTGARPRVIVGLVGGRDQGGCTDAVSYSPPFGAAVRALMARAVSGDDPDTLPAAPSDC